MKLPNVRAASTDAENCWTWPLDCRYPLQYPTRICISRGPRVTYLQVRKQA